MSILSDRDIRSALSKGDILIEPFDENNLTPNGYDLTLAEIFVEDKDRKYRTDVVSIPPKSWFAVSTKEYIKLGNKFAAQLWIRTTWARKGIISSFGKIDAGFEGNLTLSAFNGSRRYVEISIGETFAQVVFEKLTSKAEKVYKERGGKYMRQRGIRLR